MYEPLVTVLNSSEDDQEYSIVISLGAFKYDGETLLNFFAKDKSDFEGDNLKKLYPVIACMTPAQLASINEYVSIFTLLQQTLAASIVDNSDKGKLAEIEKDKEDLTKKDLTEVGDQAEKMVSVLKNEEPASIYEGIDREIYKGKGGVAVTSTAFDYSKGAEKKWSDVFVDQDRILDSLIEDDVHVFLNVFIVECDGHVLAAEYV